MRSVNDRHDRQKGGFGCVEGGCERRLVQGHVDGV